MNRDQYSMRIIAAAAAEDLNARVRGKRQAWRYLSPSEKQRLEHDVKLIACTGTYALWRDDEYQLWWVTRVGVTVSIREVTPTADLLRLFGVAA